MANHPIEADFSDRHRQKVIIIAALVSAIGFIDATALNVALPFIQESLNASATDIHWVLEIYLLFLAALLMAGGALGDTLGRRRPLRWGVGLFALISLGCAIAFCGMADFLSGITGHFGCLDDPGQPGAD